MKKRWIGLCTALILLAGVCASGPLTSGAAPADPVNVNGVCSLTVTPAVLPRGAQAPVDYWNDMQKAQIVVDLYKVADAEKVPGYDTYAFNPESGYDGLGDISDYTTLQGMTADEWEREAYKAAKIALEKGTPQKSEDLQESGTKLDDLDPGLYLVIAHGKDLTPDKYRKTLKEALTTGLGETEITQESEWLVTIANTARYEYAFAPYLIALPTKPVNEEGESTTDNPGPWIYDREIFLKGDRSQRYGDLLIRKTLRNYEEVEGTIEPVTFVFHVTAELDGETVYDEVESLTFSGDAGTDSVTMTGIPATAQVTVREEYTGISYTQDVPTDNGVVLDEIEADSVVEADFANVYNNNRTHGHGIKNRFVYNEAENEWEWHPDPEQTVREEGE